MSSMSKSDNNNISYFGLPSEEKSQLHQEENYPAFFGTGNIIVNTQVQNSTENEKKRYNSENNKKVSMMEIVGRLNKSKSKSFEKKNNIMNGENKLFKKNILDKGKSREKENNNKNNNNINNNNKNDHNNNRLILLNSSNNINSKLYL